jgi:hypothetical protein
LRSVGESRCRRFGGSLRKYFGQSFGGCLRWDRDGSSVYPVCVDTRSVAIGPIQQLVHGGIAIHHEKVVHHRVLVISEFDTGRGIAGGRKMCYGQSAPIKGVFPPLAFWIASIDQCRRQGSNGSKRSLGSCRNNPKKYYPKQCPNDSRTGPFVFSHKKEFHDK